MIKKITKDSRINSSFKLIGLKSYFQSLSKLYDLNRFPKVLLLTGSKGIGKFTLAFHLVNHFLSKKTKNPYNFDENLINIDSIAYKEILLDVSQNFYYISNESHNKTSIENIRNLRSKFNNTVINELPRFVIFDDVEQLNINSANSLLKFIEEPSDANYFILINNRRSPMIETIKSRSIETKIFLNNNEKQEIFDHLLKINNLEENFSHKYLEFTTPGSLNKYSKVFSENNFDLNSSFYDITSILLEKYKKTKNDLFLDSINFFLEIKYKIDSKNNYKFINLVTFKNGFIKLLYDYKKFNLTNNTILEFIKKSENLYA